MSRHKRHKRLLDHLARLGYEVVKVTNGENTCKVMMITKGGNKFHRFIVVPGNMYCFRTPPLIPLFKNTPKQPLEWTVRNVRTGRTQKMYTWKSLANFVERMELLKQIIERGKDGKEGAE